MPHAIALNAKTINPQRVLVIAKITQNNPIAPKARPSPKRRFSRRERAAPDPIGRGEAAGFSRRIKESYASRDGAKRQNDQPAKRPVIAKITFLPNRVKRGLIVFLNAKLRCNFSGGPPVKTGGFPACGGRRGLRPLEKISARFASQLYHPVGNRRAFLLNEKRSRLTNGLCHPPKKIIRT